MILHPDRGSAGGAPIRNGVVIHDSEGQEGTLPWGQLASAQLVGLLERKGDRPSPTRPGAVYGAGYQAVACEAGTYITVADDTYGPYHAGGGFNPNWWSICMPGKAAQTRDQWLGDVSRQYIRAVARYVVDRWIHDGKTWPLTFVTGGMLKTRQANLPGRPCGYTSHGQVTVSKLVKTDHTDPGPSFPWDVLADDIEALAATKPPPDPEKPPVEDLMIAIYECTDAAAQFAGYAAGPNHAALQVEWITESRRTALLDEGATVISLASTAFKECTLLGPVPTGDGRKQWAPSDFARVIGS